MLTATVTWALLLEPMLGLRPLLVPYRTMQGLALVSVGACAASERRAVHAVAAMVLVVLLAFAMAARSRAGDFDLAP